MSIPPDPTHDLDNIMAALEHRDRTSHIYIPHMNGSTTEKLIAAMQEPFPMLESCVLDSIDEPVPVLPETFLGGSALSYKILQLVGNSIFDIPQVYLVYYSHRPS